jgi:hypothetical protein
MPLEVEMENILTKLKDIFEIDNWELVQIVEYFQEINKYLDFIYLK